MAINRVAAAGASTRNLCFWSDTEVENTIHSLVSKHGRHEHERVRSEANWLLLNPQEWAFLLLLWLFVVQPSMAVFTHGEYIRN